MAIEKSVFELLKEKMSNPKFVSFALEYSLMNCHAQGLYSLVMDAELDGTKLVPGTLLRAFVASEDIQPYQIQLHNHKYDLTIGALAGNVKHHIAFLTDDDVINSKVVLAKRYIYESALLGEQHLEYCEQQNLYMDEYGIPIATQVKLKHLDIHTVSASAGSIWIVKEEGLKSKYSEVFGYPFNTDKLYQSASKSDVITLMKKIKEALTFIGV